MTITRNCICPLGSVEAYATRSPRQDVPAAGVNAARKLSRNVKREKTGS